MLDIIDEMIFAESIQLENRGHLDASMETYMRVVEGKTAALFRWAMFAGARAGGLTGPSCEALEKYGINLGVAFQLIDDYLDYAGDSATLGKSPFTDLREGKMTHPVIVALERDPALRPVVEQIVLASKDGITDTARARLLAGLRNTGALDATRELAITKAEAASAALTTLPPSRARNALITVASATVHREA